MKMTKFQIEEELMRYLNAALPHRRKEVLDSLEYKLAMKDGDVEAAFKIAMAMIDGAGKTKAESKRNAKKIKREDFIREIAE